MRLMLSRSSCLALLITAGCSTTALNDLPTKYDKVNHRLRADAAAEVMIWGGVDSDGGLKNDGFMEEIRVCNTTQHRQSAVGRPEGAKARSPSWLLVHADQLDPVIVKPVVDLDGSLRPGCRTVRADYRLAVSRYTTEKASMIDQAFSTEILE